jgi:hypothetical protein
MEVAEQAPSNFAEWLVEYGPTHSDDWVRRLAALYPDGQVPRDGSLTDAGEEAHARARLAFGVYLDDVFPSTEAGRHLALERDRHRRAALRAREQPAEPELEPFAEMLVVLTGVLELAEAFLRYPLGAPQEQWATWYDINARLGTLRRRVAEAEGP